MDCPAAPSSSPDLLPDDRGAGLASTGSTLELEPGELAGLFNTRDGRFCETLLLEKDGTFRLTWRDSFKGCWLKGAGRVTSVTERDISQTQAWIGYECSFLGDFAMGCCEGDELPMQFSDSARASVGRVSRLPQHKANRVSTKQPEEAPRTRNESPPRSRSPPTKQAHAKKKRGGDGKKGPNKGSKKKKKGGVALTAPAPLVGIRLRRQRYLHLVEFHLDSHFDQSMGVPRADALRCKARELCATPFEEEWSAEGRNDFRGLVGFPFEDDDTSDDGQDEDGVQRDARQAEGGDSEGRGVLCVGHRGGQSGCGSRSSPGSSSPPRHTQPQAPRAQQLQRERRAKKEPALGAAPAMTASTFKGSRSSYL
jgi:hypothetical protein